MVSVFPEEGLGGVRESCKVVKYICVPNFIRIASVPNTTVVLAGQTPPVVSLPLPNCPVVKACNLSMSTSTATFVTKVV